MRDAVASMRERERLADERAPGIPGPWLDWGPYVSERAWGTVREDYSEWGGAWESFPHDHARSRAYRWSEDGLAAVCDLRQHLCLAVALWNGADPILKERIFGLTNAEGNHGEDAKEEWWYLDATPTHSWMRWRYHYPQRAFPYGALVAGGRRSRDQPELELVDTGIFDDDRFFVVTVDHAKAAPADLAMRIVVENAGPEPATLHVLPTLWFRNTWTWEPGSPRPRLWAVDDATIGVDHAALGRFTLAAGPSDGLLFCDNETNGARLWGSAPQGFPKDGIGDHVLHGAPTVNPAREGTKAAVHHVLRLAPGETAEVRVRLTAGTDAGDLGAGFTTTHEARRREADEWFAALTPSDAPEEDARIMRQAVAGLLWSKQWYHYDVDRWLRGDPGQPVPPASRLHGRNAQWRHLNNQDVLSVPDKWEYPWFAAWDLGFHCVALAHVDARFAKHQLTLMLREWYQHPNGQLPAYEWAFGDVNPPVHAWAALRVFEIDGRRDRAFLERVFHKLLLSFTWWVNRKDSEGNNVFEGGFLGLDNIGPFDRSAHLPLDGVLEQADGTAWMAFSCLNMLEMALVLCEEDPVYEDLATKFFEHFAYIASAINDQGLWDPDDGFYYDVVRRPDGTVTPVPARSVVGLIPLVAVTVMDPEVIGRLDDFPRRVAWFLEHKPEFADVLGRGSVLDPDDKRCLAIVDEDRLRRLLEVAFDETEFLSPHGLRALSRRHLDRPLDLELAPGFRAHLGYEPAESRTGLFGGNSNWRGPVWFPINYLFIEALRRYHDGFGDGFTVEFPTGSGNEVDLRQAAGLLADRLVGLFRPGPDGRRPVFGGPGLKADHPRWRDLIPFHEYFHGDTGAGLGAAHQTGWTALVAALIRSADAGTRAALPPP